MQLGDFSGWQESTAKSNLPEMLQYLNKQTVAGAVGRNHCFFCLCCLVFFVIGPLKAQPGRAVSGELPSPAQAAKTNFPPPKQQKTNTPPPQKKQKNTHSPRPAQTAKTTTTPRPNSKRKKHGPSPARPNSEQENPPPAQTTLFGREGVFL